MSILECTTVTSLSSEGCEFRQVYSSVGCITQLYLVREKSAVISPALQKSAIQKAVMQNRMKRVDEVEHLLLDALKDKRKKYAARDRSSIDKEIKNVRNRLKTARKANHVEESEDKKEEKPVLYQNNPELVERLHAQLRELYMKRMKKEASVKIKRGPLRVKRVDSTTGSIVLSGDMEGYGVSEKGKNGVHWLAVLIWILSSIRAGVS